MPERRRDHDRRIAVDAAGQVRGDRPLLLDGEEPVAVDAEHERAGRHPPERLGERAAAARDVVRVHRLDEAEVAARVEASRELVAVEVEVALDREAPALAERVEHPLPRALEPLAELGGRPVVEQRHAPREGEAAEGPLRLVVVVAVAEQRIHADRLELHRVEGDLVGARHRAGGEQAEPLDAVRMLDGPLERVHAAHRSADDGREPVDAERVGEADLRGDLVADRQVREARPPFDAVGRERGRAGRALAAAERVGGDDEPAVGVDRETGPDDAAPPSGRGMPGAGSPDDVTVAGQRVHDEHRVVAGIVQRAPRLVGEPSVGERRPRLERDRAHPHELPVAGVVALAPGARRRRRAQHRAPVGLGDERRGHRVFARLPVHAAPIVSHERPGPRRVTTARARLSSTRRRSASERRMRATAPRWRRPPRARPRTPSRGRR